MKEIGFLLLLIIAFVPNVNAFASNGMSVTNLNQLQLNDGIECSKVEKDEDNGTLYIFNLKM